MTNNKARTVCFTGHRHIAHPDIPARLDSTLADLYAQGYRHFCCGGAVGFDTLAGEGILKLRLIKPDVTLNLILPFPAQADKYTADQRVIYEYIKSRADTVTYTAEAYHRGCYHARNRALVDASSVCVAYMYKNSGGTAYTADYARRRGLQVINLTE